MCVCVHVCACVCVYVCVGACVRGEEHVVQVRQVRHQHSRGRATRSTNGRPRHSIGHFLSQAPGPEGVSDLMQQPRGNDREQHAAQGVSHFEARANQHGLA
eukprot:7908222-Lingulodinium_polyedra.AAC.1